MEKPYTHRLSRTAAMLMAAAAAMPLATTTVCAAPGGIAQRELARRMALVSDADRALQAGREAYAQQDFETAVAEYRRALELLPQAPSTANRRQEYVAHLSDASVALAQHYRKVGKSDEARGLIEVVTAEDPTNAAALQQLDYLDDPIRTNPALTYDHTKKVDEVRRLLYTAQGYFDLGDYDKAEATYLDVLRIDKYNKAARRGMEHLEAVKSDYYLTAYDHTRATLLAQVDKAWELAVPSNDIINTPEGDQRTEKPGASIILNKLKTIRLKSVNLEDVTVDEAIDYLRQQSRVLDTSTADPLQRGINFDIQKSSTAGADADGGLGLADDSDPSSLRINELKLRNVPILFVLDRITEKANLKYKIDEFAVTIIPRGASSEGDLFNRVFRVPPDFQVLLDAGGGGGAVSDDPFATADGGANTLRAKKPVKDLLEAQGVAFPPGSSASIVGGGSLVVNNTPTALDQIESIVDSINAGGPKQIMISTKFVEISQENTDELGFDWLITPFGLGGGESLFLGGGTTGSGTPRGSGDFVTAVGPNRSTPVLRSTGGGTDTTSGILTAGNRSGEFAVDSNSIDAILNNPNRSAQSSAVAPGILSLTGLFTDGQVQLIMRGLQQKRGTDIMTAPSVLARNGQQATIEIVREFIYPTEYEPPELPNQVGIGGGFNNGGGGGLLGGGGGQSAGIFPVTPATPTAFETRNTGVTLLIEPTVDSNNYTIDLTFVPEIVEFEGFVNYGSPIQSPGTDSLGNSAPVTITDNRIEQPVFSSRRVNTGLTIYDGHTVAVGGLMREDVQNVQDSVPILGDIPVIGRLFQTKAENRIKSNLIIFVTARIIDPTGRPVNDSSGGEDSFPSDLPELPN